MMVPSTRVRFHEKDLSALLPACTPFIAAAFTAGWRLALDGLANHWDEITGKAHLVDFKGASARKLDRYITFRFRAKQRPWLGEVFGADTFIARCQADDAFLRSVASHPHYAIWMKSLATELPNLSPRAHAHDPDLGGGITAPFRADPATLRVVAAVHRHHEGGTV